MDSLTPPNPLTGTTPAAGPPPLPQIPSVHADGAPAAPMGVPAPQVGAITPPAPMAPPLPPLGVITPPATPSAPTAPADIPAAPTLPPLAPPASPAAPAPAPALHTDIAPPPVAAPPMPSVSHDDKLSVSIPVNHAAPSVGALVVPSPAPSADAGHSLVPPLTPPGAPMGNPSAMAPPLMGGTPPPYDLKPHTTPSPLDGPKSADTIPPLTPPGAPMAGPAAVPSFPVNQSAPGIPVAPVKEPEKVAGKHHGGAIIILILAIIAFIMGGLFIMASACVGPTIPILSERFSCSTTSIDQGIIEGAPTATPAATDSEADESPAAATSPAASASPASTL